MKIQKKFLLLKILPDHLELSILTLAEALSRLGNKRG